MAPLAVFSEINLHRIVLNNFIGNLILIFKRSLSEPIIQLGLLVLKRTHSDTRLLEFLFLEIKVAQDPVWLGHLFVISVGTSS